MKEKRKNKKKKEEKQGEEEEGEGRTGRRRRKGEESCAALQSTLRIRAVSHLPTMRRLLCNQLLPATVFFVNIWDTPRCGRSSGVVVAWSLGLATLGLLLPPGSASLVAYVFSPPKGC